ncbi:RagB/SusD family nutrient uptake outer membrane protein [Chitinophaga defluvii]|uniref:RagB/SusD family nutrient uptake outer membrane protein n=1 Tax=Chitinophaga defluvii TaxID=3163343 RepID=A0ABV2T4F1_9BACT
MLKKYYSRIIQCTLAGSLLLTACSKQLDIKPESAVSPDQINAGNIQFFLNSLYRTTLSQSSQRDDYFINDLRGGNYTWTALSGNNSSYGTLITGNSVDDGSSFSSSVWKNGYSNIYSANNVISNCDKLGADGSAIKVIRAEAMYLRAYIYYQLVTTFGGVPLITTNTTDNLPRNTDKEVWAQIIKDLDEAIAGARAFKDAGYKQVSKEAAQALKARALLATGDKTGAATLAQQVINTPGLSLDADYGGIFRTPATSKEVLFAFANLKSESNLRLSSLFWPYGTTWAGSYFVQPSEEVLKNLYTKDDVRRTVNIDTIRNTDGTFNVIVSKYWDVQPLVISRLAEMYLISAEGSPVSQGITFLNALRTKRGVPAYKESDFNGEGAYLDAILAERRRELFSEGFLFFDLVRTGKALSLPNVKNNKNYYVLPIPGDQIRLSKGVLKQNEGY